jgi:hypothetical protein
MSYTVTLDGAVIYTAALAAVNARYSLISSVLTEEEDKIPKLELQLPPGQAAAGLTTGTVEVTDGTEWMFTGRIRQVKKDYFGRITATCEGALGYLDDLPDVYVTASEEDPTTVINAFYGLLTGYAADADAGRKIYPGTCDVVGYIYKTPTGQCWDTISGWLKDFGGHLTLRKSDGKLYLDYKTARSGLDSSQQIRFGVNLLDTLDRMTDLTKIETGVLAIGGIPDGETEPVTLDGYSGTENGVLFAASRATYGSIYRRVEFKEALTQASLYAAAAAYLSGVYAAAVSLKLTAVENKLLGLSPQHMKIGASYQAVSAPHGLNAAFPLLKRKLDLLEPQKSTTEYGAAEAALSEKQATWNKSSKTAETALQTASAAMTKANAAATPAQVNAAIAASEGRYGDYVTEVSTSGDWTVRKWSGGLIEASCRVTAEIASGGMTAWGGVYVYSGVKAYPAGLFEAAPELHAAVIGGSMGAWCGMVAPTDHTKDNAAYSLITPEQTTAAQTCVIALWARGN